MSDIDWTKPVEYLPLNNPSVPQRVICHVVHEGQRYAMVNSPHGVSTQCVTTSVGTFRNVPEPEPEPPAIDWMKPVEYMFSSDEPPGIVLYSDVDDNGLRHTLIRRPQTGEVVYRTVNSTTFAIFRNVQRKVKHECWLNLYEDGDMSVHTSQRAADVLKNLSSRRVDCRHIQWEVESDE